MVTRQKMQSNSVAVSVFAASLGITACSSPAAQKIQNQFRSNQSGVNNVVAAPQPVLYAAPFLSSAYPTRGGTGDKTDTPVSAYEASERNKTHPGASGDFVVNALNDSLNKCTGYITGITEGQAGQNTGFDLVSIILSGLGAVFTPVNTVRALSAGSTISQGAKSTINADLFQQMTLVLFIQQIESGYFAEYRKYAEGDDPYRQGLEPGAELGKINAFHQHCSIWYAASKMGGLAGTTGLPILPITQAALADGAMFKLDDGTIIKLALRAAGNYTYVRINTDGSAIAGAPTAPDQQPSKLVDFLNTRRGVPYIPAGK